MRLLKVLLGGYRSVQDVEFDAGPFTVLFGKNNAGKTTILEAVYGLFEPDDTRAICARGPIFDPAGGREVPVGAAVVDLDPGIAFDDNVVGTAVGPVQALGPQRVAFTNFITGLGHLEGPDANDSHWDARVTDPNLHVLFLDWEFKDVHERVEKEIAHLAAGGTSATGNRYWPWLGIDDLFESRVWIINPEARRRAAQLGR